MHVSQLAKTLKTTPDTVRYYTRIGLLRPRRDSRNAYKCYSEEDKKRLRFILCARQLDFTVDEIDQILAQTEQDNNCSPEIVDLLQQRLDEVQVRLSQTMLLKHDLRAAMRDWQENEHAPTGDMLSAVIKNFAEA